MQSPINIDSETKKEPWTMLKSNMLINFYDQKTSPKKVSMINNGATIEVYGNFGRLVLPPVNLVYDCQHLHFHTPSEHTISN